MKFINGLDKSQIATPEIVDLTKSVKDFDSRTGRRGLTRNPNGDGFYSATGIYGDPTLAPKGKGKNSN